LDHVNEITDTDLVRVRVNNRQVCLDRHGFEQTISAADDYEYKSKLVRITIGDLVYYVRGDIQRALADNREIRLEKVGKFSVRKKNGTITSEETVYKVVE
jgi:hypothetical protein